MPADNPLDNARTRVVDSGAPLALQAGTLLGRYRIDSVLGQGGFGITYRATDTALNRAVAIKEYLPSDVAIRIDGSTVIPRSRTDAEDYDWGLKRFLDEAKTLAQHEAVPNVVRVYDFVEANGTAYMVMALVEGENLSTILRQRGTLSEQELLGIVLPLLDGLEQLHQAGVIHRDIKPANIILRGGRAPTLIDFGAAREGLGRKSRSVTSILTPGYAPFEQYGSAGDQGPWTDIYALAATLYHGIAGKAPPDSVDRIRRDPMIPAVQAGAGRYREQFLAAIDAGLKVDERERPQTADQWRALFGSAPTAATAPIVQPTTVAQPVLQQPASQAPASQPTLSKRQSATVEPPPSITPQPHRSSRKLLIAAGVAVLLIGGVAAVALMSGGSRDTAADQATVQLAETEKKRAAELEKKLAAEAESRKKLEAQVAEAEARRKAEEEARRKAAEEARLKAEAEAREKAEAENRRRIEEDTRKKVEAEFKARAEDEARKRQAEEEAKRKADEEAKRVADAEAKRKAEDEAKKKAEDEARKKAEQQKPSSSQVAANSPPADPTAYVAQHWPAIRQSATAYLGRRGHFNDPITNFAVRFSSVESHRVESVTPTEITLGVTYSVVTGSGTPSRVGLQNIQMRFRNQPPGFSVINSSDDHLFRSAGGSAPTAQSPQVAAAPPPLDPATFEAEHGATLRQRAEQTLRARGDYTDPQTGSSVYFLNLNSINVARITASEVVVQASYQTRERSGFNRTQFDRAELRFRNQPPSFPLIAIGGTAAPSAAPAGQSQIAAAPAQDSADPTAYVAQHWPVMKPKIEAALKQRGAFTDTVSGTAMRFDQIYTYRVVQVTAAQVVLAVTYRNMRAVPGGGNMTGGNADVTETATFQNQPPNFPLVSLK